MPDVAGQWDDLDSAFDELEAELTDVVRGMSVSLWNDVLRRTPQFYGRMAASWTYSLGAPVFIDRSQAVDTDDSRMNQDQIGYYENSAGDLEEAFLGRRRGDPEAIAIANFANQGREQGFQLGMSIWFGNGVDHGEGSYSWDVENGNVRLRAANRPGAPASRSLDAFAARFGRDVSAANAALFKTLKIG